MGWSTAKMVFKNSCSKILSALAVGSGPKEGLVVLLVLMGVGRGGAAIDPGLKTPYHLRVVLHIADNRFLTPIFQEQVERELRDHLQLTYGPLARVEVVRAHPLLREVLAKGLQQALDGWEELSADKTHFVLIDYVHGRYELQARQHDGKTGLSSPAVRHNRTSDRRLVAPLAARLVDRDFGLVGTVVKTGPEVYLALQGGDLGVDLKRWIQPGEVFAVSRIVLQGGKQGGSRIPWALLQVVDQPQQGLCRCRYYHRFQEDQLNSGPGVAGYRCLKLGTTVGPVRLCLIGEGTDRPLDGVQVQASGDFKNKVSQMVSDSAGLAVSKEAFSHLALVRILKGEKIHAQFPVAIVDQHPIVCRLRLGEGEESVEGLELRKDQWVRRIYDDLRAASERVLEVNEFLGKSLEKALEGTQTAHKELEEELAALVLERDQLRQQATSLRLPAGRLDLREGEQRLEELRDRRRELERFTTRLQKALKEAKSERTRNQVKLLARARLLETEADFDQALALYKKVLEDNPEQPKVRAHWKKLKEAWEVRSPEHARAREFLVKAWPVQALGISKERIAEARKAFAVCKKHGDVLTPQKLLRADALHAAQLKKRLAVLKRQDTVDNRTEARNIAQVAQDLRQLHAEVSAYLEKAKK